MSGRSSAVMFIFLVAIALAAKTAEDLSAGGGGLVAHRQVASAGGKPALGEPGTGGPVMKHTEKIRGPVSAAVELIGAAPAVAGDVFVLKGVISTRRSLNNVSFKWAVPSGVEVVSGEVSGVIPYLSPDREYVAQVTLRSLVSNNAQIHLSVNGVSGARAGSSRSGVAGRFSDSAQFNTMTQALLDDSKRELLKSTIAHGAEKQKRRPAAATSKSSGAPGAESDHNVFE